MTIFYGLYSVFFAVLAIRCAAAGLAFLGQRETMLWLAAALVFADQFGEAFSGFLKAVSP